MEPELNSTFYGRIFLLVAYRQNVCRGRRRSVHVRKYSHSERIVRERRRSALKYLRDDRLPHRHRIVESVSVEESVIQSDADSGKIPNSGGSPFRHEFRNGIELKRFEQDGRSRDDDVFGSDLVRVPVGHSERERLGHLYGFRISDGPFDLARSSLERHFVVSAEEQDLRDPSFVLVHRDGIVQVVRDSYDVERPRFGKGVEVHDVAEPVRFVLVRDVDEVSDYGYARTGVRFHLERNRLNAWSRNYCVSVLVDLGDVMGHAVLLSADYVDVPVACRYRVVVDPDPVRQRSHYSGDYVGPVGCRSGHADRIELGSEHRRTAAGNGLDGVRNGLYRRKRYFVPAPRNDSGESFDDSYRIRLNVLPCGSGLVRHSYAERRRRSTSG